MLHHAPGPGTLNAALSAVFLSKTAAIFILSELTSPVEPSRTDSFIGLEGTREATSGPDRLRSAAQRDS